MSYEMPSRSEEETKNMGYDQLHFYGESKAYQERWNKVSAEKSLLYPNLLEAEALWGNELNNLFKEVFILENELFCTIQDYLEIRNHQNNQDNKNIDEIDSFYKNCRKIMYAKNDERDEYRKNMMDKIEKIEQYLKPRLKRI